MAISACIAALALIIGCGAETAFAETNLYSEDTSDIEQENTTYDAAIAQPSDGVITAIDNTSNSNFKNGGCTHDMPNGTATKTYEWKNGDTVYTIRLAAGDYYRHIGGDNMNFYPLDGSMTYKSGPKFKSTSASTYVTYKAWGIGHMRHGYSSTAHEYFMSDLDPNYGRWNTTPFWDTDHTSPTYGIGVTDPSTVLWPDKYNYMGEVAVLAWPHDYVNHLVIDSVLDSGQKVHGDFTINMP
ncbi:hypothetical protein [Bifidobacterium dolichotidis]|nr:hypothetical protein [Bifidobacterium dolichotidis]